MYIAKAMAMSIKNCSSATIICSRPSTNYMHFPVVSVITAKRLSVSSLSYKTNSSEFPTLKNFNGERQSVHFLSMQNFNMRQYSSFDVPAKKRKASEMEDIDEYDLCKYEKLGNGLYYMDLKIGNLEIYPEFNKQVSIRYEYHSYKESGELEVKNGNDEVCLNNWPWAYWRSSPSPFHFKGFNEAILTMKVGGERKILIPKKDKSSWKKPIDYEIYVVILMSVCSR